MCSSVQRLLSARGVLNVGGRNPLCGRGCQLNVDLYCDQPPRHWALPLTGWTTCSPAKPRQAGKPLLSALGKSLGAPLFWLGRSKYLSPAQRADLRVCADLTALWGRRTGCSLQTLSWVRHVGPSPSLLLCAGEGQAWIRRCHTSPSSTGPLNVVIEKMNTC